MNGCLASIIIPAYNAEKTIKKCIESVQQFTCYEIEIIVINDGSQDNTCELVESIALKDERIILINQVNQGVSVARNKGIDVAKGKFVVFIDADDYLINDIFKYIYVHRYEDFLLFPLQKSIKQDGNVTISFDTEHVQKEIIYPIDKEFEYYKINAPWSKAYALDVIKKNDIKFEKNLKIGEDSCFNFQFLECIQKVVFINIPVYFYDINEESVTRRFNKDLLNIDVSYQIKVRDLCYKKETSAEFDRYLLLSSLNGLWRCCLDYFTNKENNKSYESTIREYRKLKDANDYFKNIRKYKLDVVKKYGCLKYFVFKIMEHKSFDKFMVVFFMLLRNVRKKRN